MYIAKLCVDLLLVAVWYGDVFYVTVFAPDFRVRAIFCLVAETELPLYLRQQYEGRITSWSIYPFCFVLPVRTTHTHHTYTRTVLCVGIETPHRTTPSCGSTCFSDA